MRVRRAWLNQFDFSMLATETNSKSEAQAETLFTNLRAQGHEGF